VDGFLDPGLYGAGAMSRVWPDSLRQQISSHLIKFGQRGTVLRLRDRGAARVGFRLVRSPSSDMTPLTRNDLPVTAADVRAAVDAVLAGQPVDPDQRSSIGCGIKWR
jgi:hypothetical protein